MRESIDIAERLRYGAGQAVLTESQVLKIAKGADTRRDCSDEPILPQKESRKTTELADFIRNTARHIVTRYEQSLEAV